MKLAVGGGTGFIGRALIRHLQQCGDEVIVLSRSSASQVEGTETIAWSDVLQQWQRFADVDAIVNLSGESINQRWTPAAKTRILESRLETARILETLINRLEAEGQRKPVVVQGSGMSIYGTSETETFDERSPHRIIDFLSSVVERWEEASDRINASRLVKIRIGVVLGTNGGALPPMAMPYKMGVGGRVGSGKQWLSWIHIEDMVRLIRFCAEQPHMAGAVNATAPNPARNDNFGRALGRAMHRPHWMPVPAFALRLLFGEMADLLLYGQRVIPQALLDGGFQFRYETADAALRQLYGDE